MPRRTPTRAARAAALIVLATAAFASSAAADSRPTRHDGARPVTLVVQTNFDGQPGLVLRVGGAAAPDCAAGTVDDTAFSSDPPLDNVPPGVRRVRLIVGKTVHCASGDLMLTLRVVLDLWTGVTRGRFVVDAGTGLYRGVSGGGAITGDPFDGGIVDSYHGVIAWSE